MTWLSPTLTLSLFILSKRSNSFNGPSIFFPISNIEKTPCIERVINIRQPLQRRHRKRETVNGQSAQEEDVRIGLYVHIPYCRRRCHYCDFAIVPVGGKDPNLSLSSHKNDGFHKMDLQYKNAVLDEIFLIASSSAEKIPLRSIYFGGGTPSLAPLSTLQEIMYALMESESSPFYVNADDSVEITIEMDPGTFDEDLLMAVKKMGFNRISLGVQSFDDGVLAALGRVHRSADVYSSVDMIRKVYGEEGAHYSIDLISGSPGLSLATWAETLSRAVALHPRPLHVSIYDLQVEKGTSFGRWYEEGVRENQTQSMLVGLSNEKSTAPKSLPTIEDCAFMYRYASGYLRSKNYEHYEISSYAYIDPTKKTTHRSKHNQIYWEIGGQWHAIGLSATSYINQSRFTRPRALSDYVSWVKESRQKFIEDKVSYPSKPPWVTHANESTDDFVHENDELLNIVMTCLRTSDGLDLDTIAQHQEYDESFAKAILQGFELALDLDLGMRVFKSDGTFGIIRLNDPNGFLFSNNLISNIFVALDRLRDKRASNLRQRIKT